MAPGIKESPKIPFTWFNQIISIKSVRINNYNGSGMEGRKIITSKLSNMLIFYISEVPIKEKKDFAHLKKNFP